MDNMRNWRDFKDLLVGDTIIAFNKTTKLIATESGRIIDLSLWDYCGVSTALLPEVRSAASIAIPVLDVVTVDGEYAWNYGGSDGRRQLDIEIETKPGLWMKLLRIVSSIENSALTGHQVALFVKTVSGENLYAHARTTAEIEELL